MHPTLAAFADRYRHAFSDLVITGTDDDLRLEWQEGPEAPCYVVEVYVNGEGVTVFDYTIGFIDANGADLLDVAVLALSRERDLDDHPAPILAAPGSFGALVLERRLLNRPHDDRLDAARYGAVVPLSPDRLT